jgi:hypothetical protein
MDTRAAKTDVRRVVLAVTISSFSIAALMGIAALLGAGDFGETGWRVLATTVVVGCASVVTLCCLVPVGGRFQLAGTVGVLLTTVTAALGLVLVWGSSDEVFDDLGQLFGVAVTASLTMAQICLLLGLAGERRRLATLMWTTTALAVLVGAMVGSMIYGNEPADVFLRAFGIVSILDVLGTVVCIATSVFGKDSDSLTITVPPSVASRLRTQAHATGRPVRDLVDEALTRYVDVSLD